VLAPLDGYQFNGSGEWVNKKRLGTKPDKISPPDRVKQGAPPNRQPTTETFVLFDDVVDNEFAHYGILRCTVHRLRGCPVWPAKLRYA
jgi:hypothetical protein